MRTIRQALEHAWQQREYASPDSPNLVSDFVLLAEELNRLRSYVCDHPPPPHNSLNVAYVSAETDRIAFSGKREIFGAPVVIDDGMTAREEGGVHFPQSDGTCQRYNV